MKHRIRKKGKKSSKTLLISPLLVIFIWIVLNKFKLVNELFLPEFENVIAKLYIFFIKGSIYKDIIATLFRMLCGYFIAALIGIPIGIVIGHLKKIYQSFEVLIDFLRSIPSPVLVPLAILFFDIGDLSKIMIVAFTCGLINIVNTVYGVKNVSNIRKTVVLSMSSRTLDLFRYVIFWDSLPNIFVGLKLNINLSLIVVAVTEMFVGTDKGIGYKIFDSHETGRISEMYAAIIIIGLLGYVLNVLFKYMENNIIHWRGK